MTNPTSTSTTAVIATATPHQMLAALADVVQRETAKERADGRGGHVQREPRRVRRHHVDDEQIRYLRQREDRGVEERDEHDPRRPPRQGESLNGINEAG